MAEGPTPHRNPASDEAPLPADRAFVVQLRPQGEPGGELFVGRVEHIASGAAARFGSAEALLAFIHTVLVPATTFSEEEATSPMKDREGR